MKTSIVVVTYNKLSYLKLCVESIKKYSIGENYELIIVDNMSTDGTRNWLAQKKDIKKIYNSTNLGFTKGCNQGILKAQGDNVLLLNNDVIVTENWLSNLIKCLYTRKEIGAVGPITNNCSNAQLIRVSYNSIKEMELWAKKYNAGNDKSWEERKRLIGFCLLIKREVINTIGLLDERFSPGNFEDDDYCFRMRKAGYRLILCKNTFVHHFGSISFSNSNYYELLKINKEKFEKKWKCKYEEIFN